MCYHKYLSIALPQEPMVVSLINQPINLADTLLRNSPFIVTAIIVLCAAIVTFKSNKKSIKTQNDIAHQNRINEHKIKISEFRHQWIQEVRETTSDLCQIIHDLQLYTMQRNLNDENHRSAAKNGDEHMENAFVDTAANIYEAFVAKRSQYYRVSTKLKLLFKEGDQSTLIAFKLIDQVKEDVHDFEKFYLEDAKIDAIIREFKTILKNEWEVTKDRSW